MADNSRPLSANEIALLQSVYPENFYRFSQMVR